MSKNALVEQTDKLCDEEEKSMMDGKVINYEAKVSTLVEQLATTICSRDGTKATVSEKEPKAPTITKRKSTKAATNNKNKNKSKETPTQVRKSPGQQQKENNDAAGLHSPSQSPVHKRVKLTAQSSDSPGHKEIRQQVLEAKIKIAKALNAT
jgi:hypothetical protein